MAYEWYGFNEVPMSSLIEAPFYRTLILNQTINAEGLARGFMLRRRAEAKA